MLHKAFWRPISGPGIKRVNQRVILLDINIWGYQAMCTMTSLNGTTYSALLALCGGIHRSRVDSPHKGQWRWPLICSLITPEQTVEQTIETSVIWDAIAVIMTSLQYVSQSDISPLGMERPREIKSLPEFYWYLHLCDCPRKREPKRTKRTKP